ncbi:MAG: amino acid ABC transporter permease [Rhizobiales bacterium]|nr:amino acid ABC transporter permease [Hyphomicrobiales bacterium]
MSNSTLSFVRTTLEVEKEPPASTVGVLGWVRKNLFSGWLNTALTLFALYLVWIIVPPILNFVFFDAIWTGEDGSYCRHQNNRGLIPDDTPIGACWAFVDAKFGQFIYGRYPADERWRVNIVFFMMAIGTITLAIPSLPYKKWNAIFMLVIFPILAFFLLVGGYFGIAHVETPLWGGLLVTLVVAITGIVVSLPLGVVFALGRRSEMPVVRLVSIIFIEFWRGVPLITVLFMASVMLPLFLPEGVTFDKLMRVLIGVALFSAAYMAEVVRGGLQAIPKGQYEGAQALGLPYWKTMNLIILPQALKLVIPGIVNTFIGLYKDTTLVLIVGLFDLLGAIQLSFTDPKWSTPGTSHTGYVFAAIGFFIFCFSMSRYSIFMENRLHTGHKR